MKCTNNWNRVDEIHGRAKISTVTTEMHIRRATRLNDLEIEVAGRRERKFKSKSRRPGERYEPQAEGSCASTAVSLRVGIIFFFCSSLSRCSSSPAKNDVREQRTR